MADPYIDNLNWRADAEIDQDVRTDRDEEWQPARLRHPDRWCPSQRETSGLERATKIVGMRIRVRKLSRGRCRSELCCQCLYLDVKPEDSARANPDHYKNPTLTHVHECMVDTD